MDSSHLTFRGCPLQPRQGYPLFPRPNESETEVTPQYPKLSRTSSKSSWYTMISAVTMKGKMMLQCLEQLSKTMLEHLQAVYPRFLTPGLHSLRRAGRIRIDRQTVMECMAQSK